MTGSTIQVESSNMQNILIALVVICAIVYGYLEFRKVHTRLQELEQVVGKLHRVSPTTNEGLDLGQSEPPQRNQVEPVDRMTTHSIPEVHKDIIMDDIINHVEADLSENPNHMNGLFISVESTDNIVEDNIVEDNLVEDTTGRIVELDIEADESIVEEGTTVEEGVMSLDQELVLDVGIDEGDNEGDNEGDIDILRDTPSTYEEYTIRELKDTLTDMNLPTSGNKTKLIERIISHGKKM